jgi:hypothetical protein
MHACLQPKVAETYEPNQTKYAKKVVLDILDDPKIHQMHVKKYFQCMFTRCGSNLCSLVMQLS